VSEERENARAGIISSGTPHKCSILNRLRQRRAISLHLVQRIKMIVSGAWVAAVVAIAIAVDVSHRWSVA
jgi:hypothetical protein